MPEDRMVERLHGLLSDALQQNRPRPFDSPVTVAEIYQDLVPYRSVRTALGFQMNADYEHTLLRLLAGEHGLARLEPAEARDELRSELETPNPNVGLFRKFAACDVWVTPGAPVEVYVVPAPAPAMPSEPEPTSEPEPAITPQPEPAITPQPEAAITPEPEPAAAITPEPAIKAEPEPAIRPEPEPAIKPGPEPAIEAEPVTSSAGPETDVDPRDWSVEAEAEQDAEEWEASLPELILDEEVAVAPAEADAIPPAPAPEPPPAEPSHQTEATTMPEAAASPAAPSPAGSCAFCASDLPTGRTVRFCPFCGQDQSFRPCVSCAEPLESTWTFCIACGSRQETA